MMRYTRDSGVPNGIVTLKKRTLTPSRQRFVEHAHEVVKPFVKRKR
jgi:hypothetical protein